IEDTASKETELNEFNKAVAELESKLKIQQEVHLEAQQQEEELAQQLAEIEQLLSLRKEQLAAESRKLDARQNEYNLTKSLVDNLEGFPESIRFLKKNTGWAKQAPLFSDVLFCKEEYRIAIENYLEPVMNHYVVETYAEAVQAVRLLSDSSRGRAQFFVLEAINKLPAKSKITSDNPNLLPALEIIDVEARYRPLCEHLLSHVLLLLEGDEEGLGVELPESDAVILSKSGKFSKSPTGMAGGSVGLFEGTRIGRAKNLENLAKEIRSLENKISGLKTAIEQDGQKIIHLKENSKKEELQTLQQELHRLQNELVSVKTRQEQYAEFIENSQNRKQDIEQRLDAINAELQSAEPQLNELKSRKQQAADELSEKQLAYQDLSEIVTEKSTAF